MAVLTYDDFSASFVLDMKMSKSEPEFSRWFDSYPFSVLDVYVPIKYGQREIAYHNKLKGDNYGLCYQGVEYVRIVRFRDDYCRVELLATRRSSGNYFEHPEIAKAVNGETVKIVVNSTGGVLNYAG